MPDPALTPERLDELERLADAATPGPWMRGSIGDVVFTLGVIPNWPSSLKHPEIGVCGYCKEASGTLLRTYDKAERDGTIWRHHVHLFPSREGGAICSPGLEREVIAGELLDYNQAGVACSDSDAAFIAALDPATVKALVAMARLAAPRAVPEDVRKAAEWVLGGYVRGSVDDDDLRIKVVDWEAAERVARFILAPESP